MARKVFMSVLGTGFYDKCIYVGRNASIQTRFVQKAVLEDIGAKDWTGEDSAYIMLTNKAREDNWVGTNETRYNNKTKCDEHYERLEKVLGDTRLPCQVREVGIPDGKNEDEMWQVFGIVFDLLQEGDELYFDLTHAFRYLPMLLLVLGNYAKFLKNVRVVYMSYGNYEGRERDKNDPANDLAPIVDLLPLSILEDWTFAAGAFKETGRVEPIVKAAKFNVNQNVFSTHIKQSVFRVGKSLETFANEILVCQSLDIIRGEAANDAKSLIRELSRSGELQQPLVKVLDSIEERIDAFIAESPGNIVTALRWCEEYSLFQQGYTLCQEGIITLFVERYPNLNPYDDVRENRDYWSAILGLSERSVKDSRAWTGKLAANSSLSKILLCNDFIKSVRQIYLKLTACRNSANHAGYSKESNLKGIVGQLNKLIDRCIEEIFNADFPEIIVERNTASTEETHPVFINYSNHPSSNWSQKQLSAAKKLGEIVDIPFRSVAPEADSAELERVAGEEFTKILDAADGKNAVVHLMGEMTLTYMLVRKLRASGIRCVASTTARRVVENADGTKTSDFDFVRFRDYE